MNFQLTVNDLLNTPPPFLYSTHGGKGIAGDFTYISPGPALHRVHSHEGLVGAGIWRAVA
jgi:hypothetical protein